jgi:hypothetical protein
MKRLNLQLAAICIATLLGNHAFADETSSIEACRDMVKGGLRPLTEDRTQRYLGKVGDEATAICRGGEKATLYRATPWVDWTNYYATGDASTRSEDGYKAITSLGEHLEPNGRGIDGALMDLEYQRIELIKFNLFDNYTYETYIKGTDGKPGPVVKAWKEMRLPSDNPAYAEVGGDGDQVCQGELIRHRTLSGICNDIFNPLMGSSGTEFSRNAQFEATFPRLALTELTRNRHSDAENGNRLGLLTPDPQLISRKLFTRDATSANQQCLSEDGKDLPPSAECDYQKAPFFNVLAAYWIQFMTHDWFSHTVEGRNQRRMVAVGCDSEEARQMGCRTGDRMEPSLYARETQAGTFTHEGSTYAKRSPKTTSNQVTAWWDASQIYGFDELSLRRVIRDPADPAKLSLPDGYLPLLTPCENPQAADCTTQMQWLGQESVAFPANWSIGLSFYHNMFAREHNYFVDYFRKRQADTPDADSGLRNPAEPERVITYAEVSDEELFQIARLVIAAEIAKIHTIEWTTQLLYDEPLFRGMNSNWYGLFNLEESRVSTVMRKIVNQDQNLLSRLSSRLAAAFSDDSDATKNATLYSIAASGAGIFGLGNKRMEGLPYLKTDHWSLENNDDINGGVNHFGSPFNFPEEFPSVYRLHPLLPDLIDYRSLDNPNQLVSKVPIMNTVRGRATEQMHSRGLANWALSMGRQRLGLLQLRNHPHFLQNLPMPHLDSATQQIDVVALDIFRDRERGVPRFNEFRRQIGLKTLTSFDDFIDQHLPADSPARKHQQETIERMREIYGTHICDASKIISVVQLTDDGKPINDCHGFPDGTRVDNIEDVDTVVGWLAEYTRPHGFAISETQFHVFIINASRRLFSDRFFTSSFRPEFYSNIGYDWMIHNGPLEECPYPLSKLDSDTYACNEPILSNGHRIQVSPLKRLLMRVVPELHDELLTVVNVFDPWARDRGEYYSLEWVPRGNAASDPAFAN